MSLADLRRCQPNTAPAHQGRLVRHDCPSAPACVAKSGTPTATSRHFKPGHHFPVTEYKVINAALGVANNRRTRLLREVRKQGRPDRELPPEASPLHSCVAPQTQHRSFLAVDRIRVGDGNFRNSWQRPVMPLLAGAKLLVREGPCSPRAAGARSPPAK